MAPDLSSQMVEYAERTVDDILEVCYPPLPTRNCHVHHNRL